jgi:hypothetical protein
LLALLLQFVSPVVLGMVRAEQTSLLRSRAVDSQEAAWARVLPLHIHGDAAFAGLGVVMESLQLADLPGFSVGGSVHVIINNQVIRAQQAASDVWKVDELRLLLNQRNGATARSGLQLVAACGSSTTTR